MVADGIRNTATMLSALGRLAYARSVKVVAHLHVVSERLALALAEGNEG